MRKNVSKTVVLLAMLLLCIGGNAYAQRTITGTVKDAATGELLPGVNVYIKEKTSVGQFSDVEGKFRITLPEGAKNLVFSSIGYAAHEVPITASNSVNVMLQPTSEGIGEVVVTALGVKRDKKQLGFAVTEIRGDQIDKIQVLSPVTALQGKVPGLHIEAGSGGGVTSTARVSLRGVKSLGGNDQPIWVVDGVVMENSPFADQNNWAGARDFGNQLSNLNMDDFESIVILKGAAAATLYGTRGLNGAIVITSKRGTVKGIGVDFVASFTRDVIYKPTARYQNTYGAGSPFSKYDGYDIYFDKSQPEDLPLIPNTAYSFGGRMLGQTYIKQNVDYTDPLSYSPQPDNWKHLFKDGLARNYSVAISGGGQGLNYRLSYANSNAEGLFKRNSFDKNVLTFNGGGDLNKFISAQVYASYSVTDRLNPALQGNWDYANNIGFAMLYYMSRDADLKFWKDRYIQPNGARNVNYPLSSSYFFLDYNNAEAKDNSFITSVEVSAKFINSDTFKWGVTTRANYNFYDRYNENWAPDNTNVLTGVNAAYYNQSFGSNKSYTYNTSTNFSHKVSQDFSYDIRVGSEMYGNYDGRSGYMSTKDGFKVPGLYRLSNSRSQITDGSYNVSKKSSRVVGFYGFANLSFRDEIFLELTGRNDFNSTMLFLDGTGNYSYFYPAVSSSWLFTESLKNYMPAWFDLGKLRASYGVTGRGYGAYGTNVGYLNGNMKTPSDGGSYPTQGVISPDRLPSVNLKPEMNFQKEIGLELHFFGNRLQTDLTFYRSNTKNQIMNISLPGESGVGVRPINAGNFQNTGVEFSVQGTPIRTKDWRWNIGGNISHNRSKVVKFYEGFKEVTLSHDYNQGDFYVKAYEGGNFGVIQSGWTAAIYDGENEANHGMRVLSPNGTYDWYFRRASDAVYSRELGKIEPDFTGGAFTDVTWKNLTLAASLQFRKGGYIYSTTTHFGSQTGSLASTLNGRENGVPRVSSNVKDADGEPITFNDGFIPNAVFADGTIIKADNPVNLSGVDQDLGGMTFKEAYDKGLISAWQISKYYAQSFFTIDTQNPNGTLPTILEFSYVSVRDITLSYAVPKSITNKLKMRGLSAYFSLQNAFYIYNSLPNSINPDGVFRSSNAFNVTEWGGAPYSRKFVFGFNVQL